MRHLAPFLLMLTSLPALADTAPVTLSLSFDAAARSKIADSHEMVTVTVWYEGEPTAAGKDRANEIGLVDLGSETYVVAPVDQTITLGGARDGLPLPLVTEPMLTVNVYTARQVFEDNLLDCGLVSGPVAELAGKTHTIHCTLIGQ